VEESKRHMVIPPGFEPGAPRLGGGRSIQLSYGIIQVLQARKGIICRAPPRQAVARIKHVLHDGKMSRRRHLHTQRQPEPSGDVVARALQLAGLGDQAYRLDIFRLWPTAVGPKIAARTAPQSFSRGVLLVRAATTTWQNELMFLRGTIMTKLNALLTQPYIRELKVVCGHLPVRTVEVAQRPVPLDPEALAQAHGCAATIKDPEVRALFAQCMARTLTHEAAPKKPPGAKRRP
jgi:hypothetical protein